jgi:hypothetical protein
MNLNLTALEILLKSLLGLISIVTFALSYLRAGEANRVAAEAKDVALSASESAERSAIAAEDSNSIALAAKETAERAADAAERSARAAEEQASHSARQWRPQISIDVEDISDTQARVTFGTASLSPFARNAGWSVIVQALDERREVATEAKQWIELGQDLDGGYAASTMVVKPTGALIRDAEGASVLMVEAAFVRMNGRMGQNLTPVPIRVDPRTAASPLWVRTRFEMSARGEDGQEVVRERIWCDTPVHWQGQ